MLALCSETSVKNIQICKLKKLIFSINIDTYFQTFIDAKKEFNFYLDTSEIHWFLNDIMVVMETQ